MRTISLPRAEITKTRGHSFKIREGGFTEDAGGMFVYTECGGLLDMHIDMLGMVEYGSQAG